MGQKDMTEKLLEDYNDVFADIVNVLLFDGEQIILPEALEDTKIKSQYKADDIKLHEMERDVAKLWKEKNITLALCGIENQTKDEKVMPIRILGYDGVAYRRQLLKDHEDLYPVVTIVLYFGNEHWTQPRNLKEIIDIPKELEPYVNDYQIHVFEISWLTDEQVSKFQSDFRIVAEFFTQIRKNNEYNPTPQEIKHVDEVLKFLAVFGKAQEFESIVQSGKAKEVDNMCEAIDKIVARGEERGEARGMELGEEKLSKLIAVLLREGLYDAVQLVTSDKAKREEYYQKYNIV